jgi:uncharacterized repeat protein (TIGR03803 family)
MKWALGSIFSRQHRLSFPKRAARGGHRPVRLKLEQFEDRITPSSYSLSTLAEFNGGFGPVPVTGGLIRDGSGNLYGATSSGGSAGEGMVFELAHGTGTILTLASFDGSSSSDPSGLTMDASGNLYGLTIVGGPGTGGTVFELARGSRTITTLASFDFTDGAVPQGRLVLDASGNLYGTASEGGAHSRGTIFELAKGSSTITALASFNGANGENPSAGLIMDGLGNLYGTTPFGGASGDGTVFELKKGSSTITKLASFDSSSPGSDTGALCLDKSGNLYGTTRDGGAYGNGTVFELARGSRTITALASLDGHVYSGLILDANGDLYGTTADGGASGDGTVFELVKGQGAVTTLSSFDGSDGNIPVALIMDSAGNLYGSTQGGGASPELVGTLFELAKGSATIKTLAAFPVNLGAGPYGSLIMDGSGNLYGTTQFGGAANFGTVFELKKGSSKITTLASLDDAVGAYPTAGLIMDQSGNLFGTTSGHGPFGAGTVFELTKGSGTITVLAAFDLANGGSPNGGVIMDGAGNLYGTANDGASFDEGSVFEVVKGSGTITTLASFDTANGASPYAGLILDTSGNLYGTTSSGGASGGGTVFELGKGSGTITTLAPFDTANGAFPYAGLILDQSGNLYGTTEQGGTAGVGTVFELVRGSGSITTLASFAGSNGGTPSAALIMDGAGNLYGTTDYGGAGSEGTVFELARGSGTIATLASFNAYNGTLPFGGLIMDTSGNLYGTTAMGAGTTVGTIFELQPSMASAHGPMFVIGEKADTTPLLPTTSFRKLPPQRSQLDGANETLCGARATSEDHRVPSHQKAHEAALDLAHLIDLGFFDPRWA